MSEMFQVIDPEGQIVDATFPELPNDVLQKIYALMMTTRQADDKAFKLQRQGRMGTFAPSLGHEASQVGTALALDKEDWFFPYFRDLGSYITLGFPLENYYAYWMGNENGMKVPPDLNIFTLSVPVASQIPHAVGAAMALRYRGRSSAVLCTFSDGATSQGDFHEALNFAGVYRTPNVFVCYNNQYAISMPREKQTASLTLAQKAQAYGFEGILVDGNDVLAVYHKVAEALDQARTGGGPTLIEAFTYRLSSHTTSDDADKYRSQEEIRMWEARDPIKRYRLYLASKGLWDDSWEQRVKERAESFIAQAVTEAENMPIPGPEELFVHTYAEMPPQLSDQLADLKQFVRESEP